MSYRDAASCTPAARSARFIALALSMIVVSTACAQTTVPDHPYVFLATPAADGAQRLFGLEVGYAGSGFQPIGGEGLGQALTVAAPIGGAFAVVARAGMASASGATRSSFEGELQWTGRRSAAARSYLTLGAGAVREFDAVNALRGRVGAGHAFAASRLDASVAFEHPFASDRDALDLVTTVGWMHAVNAHAQLGVEAVGQDLEGFWDREEAEGGARLYLGPSGSVSAGGWRLGLTVGPVVRASRSTLATAADRPLPTTTARSSLGLRTAISRAW